jgi:ribosomal protein S18 acetylase RimI-like enzyme
MESLHGNGLVLMTLRAFIHRYSEELEDYYDEDFGSGTLMNECHCVSPLIMCMVDEKEDHLPKDIKQKIRKAGKFRRDKLKHQWSYLNPLNRIHGYVSLEGVVFNEDSVDDNLKNKKVISISTIGSSYFSRKRGVGSDLMKMSEEFARNNGYTDIILEVANEYAGYTEESESDEEDDDEEDEEDEEEDEEEEEEEEEDDEEGGLVWYPDECVIDILADEFWKKCMRKNQYGTPYYNLDKEYLYNCVYSYLYCEPIQPMEKETTELSDNPGEYEYGGFWYRRGKNSQKSLMKFYEKFGFREDPSVHTRWGCFSEIPYPSMRLSLTDVV